MNKLFENMHTCFMKKSILKLIAILTTGCAVCFAGCAKNSDNSSAAPDENKQKITRTDDITPDDDNDNINKPPRKCPDGNCGRRGPHAGRGRARRIPLGENFTFIIEIDPNCRHGKCRPQDKPDNGETAPAPDDSENGATTD